ncbi:MAG: homoserine O-acetyltransferase [Armatimonadetes bacterium]|nr:homoserine O-acetyltransferase [Armatimonadota bacterium]
MSDPSIPKELFEENERTAPTQEGRRFVRIGPFRTESGGYLPDVTIAYETWGRLEGEGENAVLICHALSGDSHAVGWWSALVGPGKAIDTERYFVVCMNALGGCQGSTGPSSPAEDGRPWGSRFPILTLGDVVEAHKRALEKIGIRRLLAVAGGSMGGMQALEWTVRFPGLVDRAFVAASCAAHTPMQIAFNEVARQAIQRDPKWRGGDYPPDDQPSDGLAVARMLGHLTYLSPESFERKFSRRLQNKERFDYTLGVEFEVESYLKHQGEKFTRRFDANSLLILTRAIDYFQLRDLSASTSRYLFVSFTSDWIYPSWQSQALAEMAWAAGLEAQHRVIDLPYGHDSFLLDGERQGLLVDRFLRENRR